MVLPLLVVITKYKYQQQSTTSLSHTHENNLTDSKLQEVKTQTQQNICIYNIFQSFIQSGEIKEELLRPGEHVFPKPVCHAIAAHQVKVLSQICFDPGLDRQGTGR
jgi:ABC-type uncharacterized transport system permease subunit